MNKSKINASECFPLFKKYIYNKKKTCFHEKHMKFYQALAIVFIFITVKKKKCYVDVKYKIFMYMYMHLVLLYI